MPELQLRTSPATLPLPSPRLAANELLRCLVEDLPLIVPGRYVVQGGACLVAHSPVHPRVLFALALVLGAEPVGVAQALRLGELAQAGGAAGVFAFGSEAEALCFARCTSDAQALPGLVSMLPEGLADPRLVLALAAGVHGITVPQTLYAWSLRNQALDEFDARTLGHRQEAVAKVARGERTAEQLADWLAAFDARRAEQRRAIEQLDARELIDTYKGRYA